jgi:hypothetical protein
MDDNHENRSDTDSINQYPQIIAELHIIHLKELMLTMFEARDKALHTAYESMGRRLDGMNEFRDTLRDQATQFISRSEHVSLTNIVTEMNHQVQTNTQKLVSKEDLSKTLADMATAREDLNSRITALESRFYLGGAGIVVIITILQLMLNYWKQ